MRFKASAFLGLALLVFGSTVLAQAPVSAEDEEKKEKDAWSYFFFEEMLQRSCDDPALRSAIALPQPKLILETTDDGKTQVTARAGVEIKKTFVFNVEVKSPRNPSGETTLVDLNGLSAGSSAKLALSWFGWDTKKDYKAIFARMFQSRGEIAGSSLEDPGTGWRMTDYVNPAISRPSAVAMLGQQRTKEMAEAYQKWMRQSDKFIPVLTIDANAEQKEFQFFTPSAGPPAGLKKTSESHMNHQFTASAGAYLWGRVYSALNYRRGTRFVDGMTKEFCAPSGPASVLNCTTLIVAPPNKRKPEALEFEARSLFGSFGVAAHLTRDLEANVTAVEVPIYFLQKMGSTSMELNGGVAVRWRSDTKDYSLSVFVGPALSTVLRMFGGQ